MTENTNLSKVLLGQTSKTFVGKIFGYGLGLVVSFILARYYGPEVLGIFAVVLTVTRLSSVLSTFGLNTGLVKYIPRLSDSPEKLLAIIRLGNFIALSFALIIGVVFWFGSDWISVNVFHRADLARPLMLAAVLIVVTTAGDLAGGTYQGLKKAYQFTVLNEVVWRALFVVVLVLGMIGENASAVFVLSGYLMAKFGAYIIMIVRSTHLRDGLFKRQVKLKKEFRVEYMSFSAKMILIKFINVLLARIDILMFGVLLVGMNDIGVYKVAVTLNSVILLFAASVNSIAPSVISQLYSTGQTDRLKRVYVMISKWIVILTFPIACSMWFYPQFFLEIFGMEYVEGATILVFLTIGNFTNLATGVCSGAMLSMTNFTNVSMVNNVIALIFNLVLNLLLIPKYGTLGGAIATCASLVMLNLVRLVEVKYLMDVLPYDRTWWPVFLGGLGTVLIAVFARGYVTSIWTFLLICFLMLGLMLIVNLVGHRSEASALWALVKNRK